MLHVLEQDDSHAKVGEPEYLSLGELLSECVSEISMYRIQRISADPCRLELFRRAVSGEQDAWECIYELYTPLVCFWVRRCGCGAGWLNEEEVASLANAAFAKLAYTLTATKFENFTSIGALLKYFKSVIHSVVADEQASRRNRQEETAGLLSLFHPEAEDLATIVVANDEARTLLQGIFAFLKTEQERSYVWMTYICGMKPQHIVAHNGELFPTVSDVYRTHANVRDKLRNYQRRMQSGRGKRSAPYLTERGTDESTS